MKIFDYDGPLMTVLTQIFDLVVLNLITLVMCVPIVTAGASLTAMHYVLWHSVRQEGDSIWKMYWRSFRQNFKQATLIWLGVLAIIAVLMLDWGLTGYMSASAANVMKILIAVLAFLLLCWLQYLFPLLSRYENTSRQTMKNAMALIAGYMPRTLGMVACWVIDGYLLYSLSIRWMPLFLMGGLSLPGYLCALLYNPIFKKLEGAEDEKKEEDSDASESGKA
ncbi:MAG: DUF624 domain-containing protein [Lachnospiraceae bacterium]|jgi:uncharacterized membrane protein YesL|nr:DUF624 domain-containing protein [Lachnospiraceae bacterium]MCH4063563.1 DUF624 domain-containing protein [Lachnospiraceae bacterium]MCI1551739.1 DUF624 domain-containing protein [Lachnospiraceae bacterium]